MRMHAHAMSKPPAIIRRDKLRALPRGTCTCKLSSSHRDGHDRHDHAPLLASLRSSLLVDNLLVVLSHVERQEAAPVGTAHVSIRLGNGCQDGVALLSSLCARGRSHSVHAFTM